MALKCDIIKYLEDRITVLRNEIRCSEFENSDYRYWEEKGALKELLVMHKYIKSKEDAK